MVVPIEHQATPTPQAIRETTREILSRPEFAPPSSWDSFLKELFKTLERMFDGLGTWSRAHPAMAWVLIGVLSLVLLAIMLHLFYLLLGESPFASSRRRKAGGSRSAWSILGGAAHDWLEALELAGRALGEGQLRRAVWIAHRVLLGLLDEQGAIRFAGWKTNAAYLRECDKAHPWYATLVELTALYDLVVYGRRSVPVQSIAQLVEQVVVHAGEGRHDR